jgi:ABC-type branched-subunit amino acid transport system substrate-binding protein
MNRREFVVWGSIGGVTALQRRGPVVRMALVTPGESTPSAAEMGIRMGVDEAERAALLFNGRVTLSSIAGDMRTAATIASLDALVKREHTTAVFGGADADECVALSRVSDRLGVLYFNVSSSDDILRGAQCRRMAFHIMPSASMSRDALVRAGQAVEADARSVAWDASLTRFGADTLNQRFEARYGRPMTDESWTGWMAVKVLWEAALRAQTSDSTALAAVLGKESTRFDGHKGRALSFRPWDHQLRQPVYVLVRGSGAQRVIEVPSASEQSTSSTAALDELGVSSDRTTCRWAR